MKTICSDGFLRDGWTIGTSHAVLSVLPSRCEIPGCAGRCHRMHCWRRHGAAASEDRSIRCQLSPLQNLGSRTGRRSVSGGSSRPVRYPRNAPRHPTMIPRDALRSAFRGKAIESLRRPPGGVARPPGQWCRRLGQWVGRSPCRLDIKNTQLCP